MKRLIAVLALAVLAAAGVYAVHFRQQTADLRQTDPQQWLRRQYALSDAQFAEVQRLESSYRPVCNRHCSDYMAAHDRLQALVASNSSWAPAMAQAMADVYRAEMECRRDMLRHAYDVSRVMAPEQGRRYLGMIMANLSLMTPEEMRRNSR